MIIETQRFFKVIGLEINAEKLATNTKICADRAILFKDQEGYKYLGVGCKEYQTNYIRH